MSSPSLTLKEEDLSSFVQSYSASQAAFAGDFSWGPVDYPYLVANQEILTTVFGKPSKSNNVSYYTVVGYLDYSDNQLLVRSAGANAKNATNKKDQAITMEISNVTGTFVKGEKITSSDTKTATVVSATTTAIEYFNESAQFINNTTITGATSGATATIVSAGVSYSSLIMSDLTGTLSAGDVMTGGTSSATGTITEVIGNKVIYKVNALSTNFTVGESIVTDHTATFKVVSIEAIEHYSLGGTAIKNIDAFNEMSTKDFMFAARYMGELGNHIKVSVGTSTNFASWQYSSLFDSAPDANEIHVVIIDVDGSFYNSIPGNILQTFAYLSLVENHKNDSGEVDYYKFVINSSSAYIYAGDTAVEGGDYELVRGQDDAPISTDIINSYKEFNKASANDVFYYYTGMYDATVDNAVIAQAESNMKTIVFTSPIKTAVMTGDDMTKANAISTWATSVTTSNRAFLDCNWRQVFDTFNNTYIWVPCASATCGISSRCDTNSNVWNSPMGYTRGLYVNTIKLAWEPTKDHRDIIYKASVNPIFTDGADGVVLLGDRTHTIKPSYFRQLAVRKTLIVIEQSALQYLKYFLGENNNMQTRALATSQISKFLREIGSQGAFRRAQVICDSSNNTEQIIDEQKMRCLIRIQPQSSINYIELTVSVVNSVAQFTENVISGTL